MNYSDLTHTEKYIYDILDNYLSGLLDFERIAILKVLNNKYNKEGKK